MHVTDIYERLILLLSPHPFSNDNFASIIIMESSLYITGFHVKTRARDLALLFEDSVGRLKNLDIPVVKKPVEGGPIQPYAFAEFRDSHHAKEAVRKLDNFLFKGCRLHVTISHRRHNRQNEERGRDRAQQFQPQPHQQSHQQTHHQQFKSQTHQQFKPQTHPQQHHSYEKRVVHRGHTDLRVVIQQQQQQHRDIPDRKRTRDMVDAVEEVIHPNTPRQSMTHTLPRTPRTPSRSRSPSPQFSTSSRSSSCSSRASRASSRESRESRASSRESRARSGSQCSSRRSISVESRQSRDVVDYEYDSGSECGEIREPCQKKRRVSVEMDVDVEMKCDSRQEKHVENDILDDMLDNLDDCDLEDIDFDFE